MRGARALVVLAGVVLLAACGGGPAGSSAGDPSGSSSGSPSGSTTSCLPGGGTGAQGDAAGDGVVGLPEADAVARAEAAGLTARVVGRGEECCALTMDFVPDRVNLDLDADGVVRGASRG